MMHPLANRSHARRPWRWGLGVMLAAVCGACDGGDGPAPAPQAPAAVEDTPSEPAAEEPTPLREATGLLLSEQTVFGLPTPAGLTTIEQTAGFARFALSEPLGDVRQFYREHLAGFREEHYGSAGTGFVGPATDGREVMLIRRLGQRALEVTYFAAGRDAAAIENRPELSDTRVRSLEAVQAAAATAGGGGDDEARAPSDPTEPTVRRIRPSEQPPLPAAWGTQPTRPSQLSANVDPSSTGPSGATRGATIGAGAGAGPLGAGGGAGGATGPNSAQRRGPDPIGDPVGSRGAVSGPVRVRDRPLNFGNPNFERPSNPNALH